MPQRLVMRLGLLVRPVFAFAVQPRGVHAGLQRAHGSRSAAGDIRPMSRVCPFCRIFSILNVEFSLTHDPCLNLKSLYTPSNLALRA